MNLTPINVVVFGTGVILIYCALKNLNPKDVMVAALHGKSIASTTNPPPKSTDPRKGPGGGSSSFSTTTQPIVSV